MRSVYLGILMMFILLSVVHAEKYGQNTQVPITHSVRVQDGNPSGVLCNITVFDPEWNILVPFKVMTPSTTTQTYNYTVLQSNTTKTGLYQYDISCIQPTLGLNQTNSYNFEITVSGDTLDTPTSILYIFMILIGGSLIFILLWIRSRISDGDNFNGFGDLIKINFWKNFRPMLLILSYGAFVWTVYNLYFLSNSFIELRSIPLFFYGLFRLSLALGYVFAFIGVLATFIGVFRDLLTIKDVIKDDQ